MTPGLSAAALSKEVRGLLPVWAACMAALAGALVSRSDGLLQDAAIVAYVVGPIALGAQSIGQEYAYRTLPMLLSQPVDRRRVLLLKFAVLVVMVLTLAALASNVLMNVAQHTGMWRQVSVQVLPVLGGLFVAPWMTMICRSALAGILCTSTLASLTYILSMAIVSGWSGVDANTTQAMILGPWSFGMVACSAVAGLLGVRQFLRLEAIEGPPPSLHLPGWLARTSRMRVHRPLRALVGKELRLQQLTFVIAACCITGTLVVSTLQRLVRLWSDFPIAVVTLAYCLILSIWIGSSASAEERQHGTLEGQLLQPLAAWQQWMMKAGVAVAVALVCGLAVPFLLFQILPGGGGLGTGPPSKELALVIVVLTAGSLYVSSYSGSGVWAMVFCLPVGVGVQLTQRAAWAMRWGLHRSTSAVDEANATLFTAPALALVLIPFLLWFGFVNHTSAERSLRRLVLQGAAIAAIIMAGVIAL